MTKTLLGVQIFSTGPQTASDGFTTTYTADDLDTIISRFDRGDPEYVPVKLGHTSPEFNSLVAQRLGVPDVALSGEHGGQDGVVSLGRVVALRRVQNKLVADFEVPDQMAQMVNDGFLRDVSVEVVGSPGDWTLTGVAWLGAELPAVKNLNGLAAAAVLRRQAAPIHAFKHSAVVEVRNMSKMAALKDKLMELAHFAGSDDDDEEDKKPEGEGESEEKSDFPPKDESGEGDEEEKEMEDEEAPGEQSVVTPLSSEVTAALKAILGVEMTAGDEEVLEALRNAVGLPSASMDEMVPMMKERLMTQATKPVEFKQSAEFKAMSEKIATLERKDRVNHYRAQVANLFIQGTPDELAEKLVKAEAAGGAELAGELLTAWQEQSKAQQSYNERVGTAKPADTNEYDFEARVKAKAEADKVDYHTAFGRLAAEDGKAFSEYRRLKNGASVN